MTVSIDSGEAGTITLQKKLLVKKNGKKKIVMTVGHENL